MFPAQINQKVPSFKDLFTTNSKVDKKISQKKVPSSSVIDLLPAIFGVQSGKSGDDRSTVLGIRRLPSNIDERILYTLFSKAICKAKYVIAQIAHLFHYELLSNSINCKDLRVKNLTGVISASSTDHTHDRSNNLKIHSGYSTGAHFNSIPSLDLEEDKQHSSRTDNSLFDNNILSTHLNTYLFETQSFLDDFDEKIVEQRLDKMRKYCIYKAQKWLKLKKKKEVRLKIEQFEIVCKICEKKFKIEKMKEHTRLCRIKAEANKEMKDAEKKISEIVFDAYMRGKELETSLRVDNKNYDKLRSKCDRSRGNTPKTKSFAKMINDNLIKEATAKSPSTASPIVQNTRKECFSLLGAKDPKKQNPPNLKQMKGGILIRSQSGKPEEVKKYAEQLDKSYGSMKDQVSDFKTEEDELSQDKGEGKKSFVGRFLEKQHLKSADSSSQNSEETSQYSKLPELDVLSHKAKSEITLLPKKETEIHFYSDPQKSDIDSDGSEDSRNSSESKPTQCSLVSINSCPLKLFESPGGSESIAPNLEISTLGASFKSNSIDGSKPSISTHKKSKFYNENTVLDQENIDIENDGITAKSSTQLFPHKSLGVIDPNKSIVQKDNSELRSRILKTNAKMYSMLTLGNVQNENEIGTPNCDSKIGEEMAKLRAEMNRKKDKIKLYEVITKQGKAIMNREPYKWKMERDREDIQNEIEALMAKINDSEIDTFANRFINLYIKRVQNGKVFQETKKLLEQTQGNTPQSQTTKINFDRLSVLKAGSLNIPPRRLRLDKSPIDRQVFTKISSETRKNLKGLIEKDITPSNALENPLVPSRNQPTFGEQKDNTSDSFSVEEMERVFNNADDIAGNKNPNEKIYEKQLEPFNYSNHQESTLAPISEITNIGFNKKLKRLDIDPINLKRPPLELPDNNLDSHNIDSLVEVDQNSQHLKETETSTGFDTNTIQINLGSSEEQGSPSTPNFDVKEAPPLIWHTTTAPTRLLRENSNRPSKSKFNSKGIIQNLRIAEINTESYPSLKTITIGPPERFDIQEDQSLTQNQFEEEKFQRSKTKNQTIKLAPRHLKQRDLVKMSAFRNKIEPLDKKNITSKHVFQADQNEEEDFKKQEPAQNMLTSTNKKTRFFAEDLAEQLENEAQYESPILSESPLLHKGYNSDTQVKNVPITLKKNQAIGIDDFEFLSLISKGAFGKVWLVKRKVTNDLYAMKIINLAEKATKNTQELENLRKENKVFGLAQEDSIVRAVFTFTHDTCICFVMEYMIGGDFGDILYNYNALDEDVARFYVAEVVLALEYLHSIGIVHRDLKPDNILLDKYGHAKLTDFGLSETGLSQKMKNLYNEPESPLIYQRKIKALNKLSLNKRELDSKIDLKINGKPMERKNEIKLNENKEDENHDPDHIINDLQLKRKTSKKHHRLIGTPDYMAPEIILGQTINNFSIDWWSLGVILFEFLCGVPPFNDESPEKIYENIVKLKVPWDQIKIGYESDCMSPEAADLIRSLLVLDYTKRLGANGASEVKQHPFFKGIAWETLRKKTPPIIPEQKSETDTANFVRMSDKISEKEKESPFGNIPSDQKMTKNIQVAKELLEAASDKFNIFNYAALESDNLRSVEEALKEKEKLLQQLKDEELENNDTKRLYDDIFDTPKKL